MKQNTAPRIQTSSQILEYTKIQKKTLKALISEPDSLCSFSQNKVTMCFSYSLYFQMSSLGVERGVDNPSLGGCQSKQAQKNENGSSGKSHLQAIKKELGHINTVFYWFINLRAPAAPFTAILLCDRILLNRHVILHYTKLFYCHMLSQQLRITATTSGLRDLPPPPGPLKDEC